MALTNNQLKRLFKDSVKKIEKQWFKNIKKAGFVNLIKDLILKGISPVAGGGRFKKYSQSYLDVISGKAKYFTAKSGYVIRVEPKLLQASYTELKFTKGKGFFSVGKTKRAKFEKFDKGLGVGKRLSPVNMKVSGEMLKSLTFDDKNGRLTGGSPLFKYHTEGLGNLPVRKLLPYEPNQEFSRRLQQKLVEELEKASKGFFKGKKGVKIKINS